MTEAFTYLSPVGEGAIEGTLHNGNYIVTYESIIPNLTALNTYKPLLRQFWKEGLFGPMDERYFMLINRAPLIDDEVNWDLLTDYAPMEAFKELFNSYNVEQGSYFDNMTHFDFKTLLPALLQVEDRVSMAHGLESRVPLLDHPIIELAATIPSNIKFQDGTMKRVLHDAMRSVLPDVIADRKNKMGFPVPLTQWFQGPANEFVHDVFSTHAARSRDLIDNQKVLDKLDSESKFGRTIWGFFSLEIWQQEFHDQASEFKSLLEDIPVGVIHRKD